MIFVGRRCFVATLVFLAVTVTAVHAQTDYYFNPPTGVDLVAFPQINTWDLSNFDWNSVNQTTPAIPSNNYVWQNDTVTNGGERANFGNTSGTVTLNNNISAYGINFNSAGYTIAGGGNVLTLYGPGGPINVNTGAAGSATISAQVAGNVGLTVVGKNAPNGGNLVAGTLTLTAANTYSGNTTVTGATLVGNPQASGSPFSSGAITLNGAILDLKAANANATSATTVGNLTIGATTGSTVGASQLIVDNQANSPSVTFAPGNLVRGGSGSALVITPNTGSLGNKENITFTNGSSLLTNGILPPWVVATTSGSDLTTDFVTYSTGGVLTGDYNGNGVVDMADYVLWRTDMAGHGGAAGYNTWRTNFGATGGGSGNGVAVATYTSTDLTTSNSNSVVNQASAPTITGNVSAYALKTNQAIDLGGHALTLGNGSGQSGLILNGGASVTNGNISFGPTEGMIFSEGNTTLGSTGNTITSNGLTITGVGTTTTTINGNIVDGTAPAKLIYTGTTSSSGLVLNGNNSYSGGTTIAINNSVNNGPSISVGTDTAFGTGKVTNILLPGTSSPVMQGTGGDRTLANAFDINGGFTFIGSQSLTFTGPFNVIQPQVGGTRTLSNTITASGKSVTYGSSGSPSTITLGNPVSNGGDGLGTTLIISSSANTSTVVNDVLVDPAAGGGTASGGVGYAGGSSSGVIRINSLNTYSGPTLLNGGSTLQIPNDTVGSYPSITSGPFGVGTLTPNNGTNNIMQPIGGDRTIANAMAMNTGFTVNNSTATGETARNIKFTGPLTLTSATGRTIANNLGAGNTLTLGDAGSPSTLTGSNTAGATIQFSSNNSGNFTVVNDVMQDGASPLPVRISNANTVTFNAQNTYSGGTLLDGAGTIIPITLSSNALPNAGFTSGPFGTGTITFNNGTNQHLRPTASDRSISNAITMQTGFAMDNATGETFNLTYAGPITMINAGKFISNGFAVANQGGSMIIGDASAPSTITLATATGQNLSFAGLSGPVIVNDLIQDATGISGNVSVNPNTNNNSPVTFTAANIFTGNANLGGGGNAASGQVQLALSTDGDFGAINSGPLGVGTIVAVSTNATTPPLTPFNADRTLSNAVNLNGNLSAANAPSENFNLNLTGPISLTASAGRSIINNMTGTLTLGKSTVGDSTQSVTLSGTAAQTLTFNGASTATTVVNDAITNGGSGFIPGNVAVSGSTVRFNNDNTFGPSTAPGTTTNTTVSGTGTLLVNNTSGSGTGFGNVAVTGGKLGGTGTISQSVTATGGAIAPGDPLVNGGAGTLNIGGNLTYSGAGGLTVELGGTTAGSTYDQLLVAGTADVSAASGGTLTVSLINSFNPSVDTDFTVLTATGGLTTNAGAGFGNFSYPDFTHWTTQYTANSVVIHYSAAGGAGAGSNLGDNSAVPEPGTFVLGVLVFGAALTTSRRGFGRRSN